MIRLTHIRTMPLDTRRARAQLQPNMHGVTSQCSRAAVYDVTFYIY